VDGPHKAVPPPNSPLSSSPWIPGPLFFSLGALRGTIITTHGPKSAVLRAFVGDGVPVHPKTWAASKSEDQSVDQLLQTLEVELQFNPLSPRLSSQIHIRATIGCV
jgi:hypothetical protein